MMRDTTNFVPVRRAFTLLELLVVITIIAILIGIIAGTGVAVIGNQKGRQTENLLSTLDRALSDFMVSNNDAAPPYIPSGYRNTPGTGYAPNSAALNREGNADAWSLYLGTEYPRHPDAAVFIRQARGTGAVDEILQSLGERWLVSTPEVGAVSAAPDSSEFNATDGTPSVLDPWADANAWRAPWPVVGTTVIYYVHPGNRLAQDLYGQCRNNRPYFFSAGPDGVYGSTTHLEPMGERSVLFVEQAVAGLEDNIYSSEIGAPNTTDDFNMSVR